jgi:transcriptional regulator with XRE-family HTH domain
MSYGILAGMVNTLRVRRAEFQRTKKHTKRKLIQGISQMDVAKATRIEFNRYWRIENGYAEPRPKERAALAKFFKCAESVLFPALATDGNGEAASVA